MVIQGLRVFCKRDEAQDLGEFTLLLAMLGLMAAAIIVGAGHSINNLLPAPIDRTQQAFNNKAIKDGGNGGAAGSANTADSENVNVRLSSDHGGERKK